jgi:hypothetical protein
MTHKIVGYRTPSSLAVPQPDITVVWDGDGLWHESSHGFNRHAPDFQPIAAGTRWYWQALDGLYHCTVCGVIVEPIYGDDEVLEAWHDLVVAVTAQDDWDEEGTYGPEDIFAYVEAMLAAQPEDAL